MKRTFTRILSPTDLSDTSDAALEYAAAFAERFGAALHIVHVFEDPYVGASFMPEVYGSLPPDLADRLIEKVRLELARRAEAARGSVPAAAVEIITGRPAAAIVDFARQRSVDLIVMGTHGRGGVTHLLLGSVAERVVRTAPCPVLTIRGAGATDGADGRIEDRSGAGEARSAGRTEVRSLLVATDFSPAADAALDIARTIAARFDASIHLLHVAEDPLLTEGLMAEAYVHASPIPRSRILDEALGRVEGRLTPDDRVRFRATANAIFGAPATTIVQYAADRRDDLIVMGTHGYTGVRHLLFGSVAEAVVRTAPCPVLTVRQAVVEQHETEAEAVASRR